MRNTGVCARIPRPEFTFDQELSIVPIERYELECAHLARVAELVGAADSKSARPTQRRLVYMGLWRVTL